MTEIRATEGLPASDGGVVTLRLLAKGFGSDTELRIDHEQRLPHKALAWTVIKITRPTASIYSLARDLTTFMCELERLHRQGYALRQRAGGGWRGAWRADLLAQGTARPALSWEIELRKPEQELSALACRASRLDVPTYRADESEGGDGSLNEAMRDHAYEVTRRQTIDALAAADPAAPLDDFLRELDARGLLGQHGQD
jgi:hypothetical protein